MKLNKLIVAVALAAASFTSNASYYEAEKTVECLFYKSYSTYTDSENPNQLFLSLIKDRKQELSNLLPDIDLHISKDFSLGYITQKVGQTKINNLFDGLDNKPTGYKLSQVASDIFYSKNCDFVLKTKETK